MQMSEESKKSIFNGGVALAERTDQLWRTINATRYNPTNYDYEAGRFNYEIMLTTADIILRQAWGKLTDTERKEGDRYSKILNDFILKKPIVTFNNKQMLKINSQNLLTFLKLFDAYEKKLKIYYEEHDLDSPNKDSEDDDEL